MAGAKEVLLSVASLNTHKAVLILINKWKDARKLAKLKSN